MSGRLAGDRGFIETEWALGVVMLLMPVMLLMGLIPTWAARHEAAAAAAREAARHAALHIDDQGATEAATAAASQVLAARGVEVGTAQIVVEAPTVSGGVAPREGIVQVSVGITGPTFDIPLLGSVATPTVTASHARRLNEFRSRP